ncbi:hypothetical protein C8Q75DRAFT_531353 [Abortiporus biennis]|nr:hypothetical protein C8Q75DRAFT_531353 [Abortiporus biennis]
MVLEHVAIGLMTHLAVVLTALRSRQSNVTIYHAKIIQLTSNWSIVSGQHTPKLHTNLRTHGQLVPDTSPSLTIYFLSDEYISIRRLYV